MFVNNIKLHNFRNHHKFECPLQRKTYIYGDNGSGKTSILEGVYLALNLRTFKKQPLKDIITFGEPSMHIALMVSMDTQHNNHHGAEQKYTLFYQDTMGVKNNGETISCTAQHLYDNPVVYYSPNTDSIIAPDQSVKRKQLDKVVFHTDKGYATNLNTYNRLLLQKRSLLSKITKHNANGHNGHGYTLNHQERVLLDTLNSQLLSAAKVIHTKRQTAINSINQNLETLYDNLDKTYPNLYNRLYLSYSSNANSSQNDVDELLKREQIEGTPLYGTHRDRINIRKDGKLFEKFSSFGQGKSFHILLLHSIRTLIAQHRGITPITLLDDFEAGLDNRRIVSLLEIFDTAQIPAHEQTHELAHGQTFGQVIITGVNPSHHINPSIDGGNVGVINLNHEQHQNQHQNQHQPSLGGATHP